MRYQGSIEYSDYYVAFLDILGFKKLVKSSKQEDKLKISKYFHLIQDITKNLKKITSKKDIGSIIISDSVILSVPTGSTPSEKCQNLRQLCVAVQKIQIGLAENDIWLRGGISSGEAYFSSKDNQVVGSAYIDAYLLEERNAKHPRVILDNKIINFLQENSSDSLTNKINNLTDTTEYDIAERNVLFEWKHRGTQTMSKLVRDVPLFVDYMAMGLRDIEHLNAIIKNIENNIYTDNRLYTKFRWVTDYLIDTIQKHHSFLGYMDTQMLENSISRLEKL